MVAGEVVVLAETNDTYPCDYLYYTVLNPDGTTLASVSRACGDTALNNEILSQTGTYTVLVNPETATGGATFTLTQNIDEPLTLNSPLAVGSTYAGQVFDLTFSGTAGEVVSLLRSRFAVREAVAPDHNGNRAGDLRNRAGEQVLQCGKSAVERRAAGWSHCQRGKEYQYSKQADGLADAQAFSTCEPTSNGKGELGNHWLSPVTRKGRYMPRP